MCSYEDAKDTYVNSGSEEDYYDNTVCKYLDCDKDVDTEELDECKCVTKSKQTYQVDDAIFTDNQNTELKKRELALIERNAKGK